jgi:hypothetical protein
MWRFITFGLSFLFQQDAVLPVSELVFIAPINRPKTALFIFACAAKSFGP